MTVYLQLFHGRDTVEEDMDDWGYEGPTLGPLEYCHVTYMSDVKYSMAKEQFAELFPETIAEWKASGVSNGDGDFIDGHLKINSGLVEFQGKFYGDFSVFSAEEQKVAA